MLREEPDRKPFKMQWLISSSPEDEDWNVGLRRIDGAFSGAIQSENLYGGRCETIDDRGFTRHMPPPLWRILICFIIRTRDETNMSAKRATVVEPLASANCIVRLADICSPF